MKVPLILAVIALVLGGTSFIMAVRQRDDPQRATQALQRRLDGLNERVKQLRPADGESVSKETKKIRADLEEVRRSLARAREGPAPEGGPDLAGVVEPVVEQKFREARQQRSEQAKAEQQTVIASRLETLLGLTEPQRLKSEAAIHEFAEPLYQLGHAEVERKLDKSNPATLVTDLREIRRKRGEAYAELARKLEGDLTPIQKRKVATLVRLAGR